MELKHEVKSLEQKLKLSRAQNAEKLSDLDKLYKETDMLKSELSRIREKYDFSEIEMNKRQRERYESWSLKMMQASSKLVIVFESFFTCGLCSAIADNVVVVEPCNHAFCKQCFEN